ncbi:hypothetical protein [Phaffia rhodozyma]|uniref:Uncharacterized protein n=1 Tax=Phaffia rhodozyma TaxID=264483 RepID=A0A0F7SMV5_PHARH|nr:hypothetical protein [Phaffia rhodozyma]
MAPYVESFSNRPSPAQIVPIDRIPAVFAASDIVNPKLRLAGHLLTYHPPTRLALLSSVDRSTAVWIDPKLCFDHPSDDSLYPRPSDDLEAARAFGTSGHAGKGSYWVAVGDLERVLPSELPTLDTVNLPTWSTHTIQIPHWILRAILLRPSPELDLRLWEQAARTRLGVS